jgi:hypothetical protein
MKNKVKDCENCEECVKEEKIMVYPFDVVSKTYIKTLADDWTLKNEKFKILCFRHWHQLGRPMVIEKGDYFKIFKNK